jgi:hypothetical protein
MVRALVVLSQEAVTTYTYCVASDFYRKHLVFLNVVVNSAAIDIDYPRRTSNSDDLDIFPTARAPDFVSTNDGGLQFRHSPWIPLSVGSTIRSSVRICSSNARRRVFSSKLFAVAGNKAEPAGAKPRRIRIPSRTSGS